MQIITAKKYKPKIKADEKYEPKNKFQFNFFEIHYHYIPPYKQ